MKRNQCKILYSHRNQWISYEMSMVPFAITINWSANFSTSFHETLRHYIVRKIHILLLHNALGWFWEKIPVLPLSGIEFSFEFYWHRWNCFLHKLWCETLTFKNLKIFARLEVTNSIILLFLVKIDTSLWRLLLWNKNFIIGLEMV